MEAIIKRMEKDMNVSTIPSKSKKKMNSNLTNKIPDEILVDILSRLSIKEAAKPSVLCHRWENLWKIFTGCLDFADDMENKVAHCKSKQRFHMEQRKFIDKVNQVVCPLSHRGSSIELFRVSFYLGKDHTSTIHRWIEFAAAKKVRRLELDLSSTLVRVPNEDLKKIYDFPSPWWWLGHDLRSLTSLRLDRVNVTDEHVSYFLSDCPLLEELSIVASPCLRNVRVVGGARPAGRQWLKLKHSEIRMCFSLEHLAVSGARNLLSFTYQGKSKCLGFPMANMHFQNVPKLSSVSLGCGGFCDHSVATSFRELPFPISQLQMLTLDLFHMMSLTPNMFPCEEYVEFAQLTNLRQLELAFSILEDQSMLFVGSLLRASPRLHKLVLKYQINWDATKIQKNSLYLWVDHVVKFGERHRQMVEGCKYECLTEVEFLGWNGLKGDVELFTHLINAAESLERITIDPSYPSRVGIWKIEQLPQEVIAAQEDARIRARDLQAEVPPTIKLVVL